MRPVHLLATVAAAVATAALAPLGTAAAQESAQQTIADLQASGYTVNIDRVGSAPLNECVVTGVRNPQTVTEYVQVYDGRTKNGGVDYDVVPVVTSRSISVSLNCA